MAMTHLLKKFVLAAASIVICFLLLEIGARLARGKPLTYWPNFVETRISVIKSVYPTQHDPLLGWIPKAGDYTDANYWGKSLVILEDGIRGNGKGVRKEGKPLILAVGDSFTFGAEVADEETWPATLERLSGARVLNGGVFAYGLDQTVLRAERLAAIFHPDVIVVSFIPDNVNRTERAVRTGASKPYFDVVGGRLELRNTPVPFLDPGAKDIGRFRRIFGHSFFVDGMMRRLKLDSFWYLGDWENVRVHRKGADVACLLMSRLAELAARQHLTVVLLAQHPAALRDTEPPESEKTVACAAANGLPVLDLYGHLRDLALSDPARFRSFSGLHMTAGGNRFVAETVYGFLKEKGFIP